MNIFSTAGVTAVVAAAAVFVSGCGESAPAPAAAVPSVVVAEASAGAAAGRIQVIGQVAADREVNLVARIKGFLESRDFKEGEVVKQGALLYRIEPDQYKADLDAAEADLARASASAANAKVEESRQKELFDTRAGSQKDYENAFTRAREAEAKVKICEAAVEQAKLNMSYTEIKAPFDGRMGLSRRDAGNLVGPESGTLSTIVAITPVRVKFKLSEALLLQFNDNRLNRGKSNPVVRLRFLDGSSYPESGTIAYWDNHVSDTTGTIELHALFPNPAGVLTPGMNVTVFLERPDAAPAVMVPTAAVQEDQEGFYIYTVADGKAQRREVVPGAAEGGLTAIISGVKLKEPVVVAGFQRIRPGAPVTTVSADAREAQHAAAGNSAQSAAGNSAQ